MKNATRITWTFLPLASVIRTLSAVGICALSVASTPAFAADKVKDPFAAPQKPVEKTAEKTSEKAADKTAEKSAPEIEAAVTPGIAVTTEDVAACKAQISKTVRAAHRERLEVTCERMKKLSACTSKEGRTIGHVDFDSQSNDARAQKRILVFGLIHGDEPLAGEMAIEWAERLFKLRGEKIEARNSWRVVPMLNPDGLERKTRMNASGVDLNRNFPTRDWDADAQNYWKKSGKSDPRRFPGEKANSEAETGCAIAQIKDFKPDFIVSVHTPYHVLDFDGPQMPFPKYKDLPWRALGNFPGSLGRYMWRDYSIPVLTVELGQSMIDAANLQDIVGTFAIDASRRAGTKTVGLFEQLPGHEH